MFRACQLKLQELVLESDTREYPDRRTDEIRTIIVIDSIKNPYESMYLKARYNNYYLIGIYTEESERRKRLREDEHMVDDDKGLLQTHIKTQVEDFFDTTDCPLRAHGKLPCYCFKDYHNQINEERNQVHTRALHAEETAFLSLGANHLRAENGILFTTSSPCELCSKKAMHLGIKTIYYVEPYAGVSEKHVLSIGERKKRPQLILFTGAIGTAYNRLYTPLLPRKDENEMWLGAKMGARLMEQIEKKRAQQEPADSVKRRCVPHAHD